MLDLENSFSKEDSARLLQVDPETLKEFEEKYQKAAMVYEEYTQNLFDKSVHLLKKQKKNQEVNEELIHRIVNELLAQTTVDYFGKQYEQFIFPEPEEIPLTPEDVQAIELNLRPDLLGNYMKKDCNGDAYPAVLAMYDHFLKTNDKSAYHLFRQGLDISDLDPILYEILGMNPNTISYWLPALYEAVQKQNFFQIPETTIIKVPIPLLQLTRLEYSSLSPTTLKIVDEYCQKVFPLDTKKEYFVKTGTYSSKFNFRNAHVKGEKEVLELGEYLLYIQHQAVMLAGSLTQPSIYGVSTTNEWCVREYVQDKENNPCIYHGMPLHTEYRVFIDCDSKEVLGIMPYWNPETMKKRFEKCRDINEAHDYAIYAAHEKTIMKRYHENKAKVMTEIEKLLQDLDLSGQWSLDIMQNGEDFYVIDMALAVNSALNECCKEKLKPIKENWIPKITKKTSL